MKIILLLVLIMTKLFGSEIQREYVVSVTLYGKIGSASYKEVKNGKNYGLFLNAKPTSFIRAVSGIKKVQYKSIGHIAPDGRYIPVFFSELTLKRHEKKQISYFCNAEKMSITKKTHIEKKVLSIDVKHLFSKKRQYHTEIEDKSKEIDYADNDYLTLMKNISLFKKGEIKYMDQKKTNKLYLISKEKNFYKIKVAKKKKKYFIALKTDCYGLLEAETYKSFKFGNAYIKTVNTSVK
ncbi:hypothetical protein [Sulfurimonas autotrophica]|uniref:hypothetical protein n=1 Tax=Sulfurimonas autotrophica TaxID=202747 RepID=UPI00145D541F|nr:hypothetical protein [Sulfurimonas autotrophica]